MSPTVHGADSIAGHAHVGIDELRPPLVPGRLDRAWVVVPLSIATLVWLPIIHNYFEAGDFHNFYLFLNDGLLEFLIAPHGGHLLVTRNLIWWLLYELAGMRSEVYFATVLLTHLFNVGLLFAATRRMTGSARAACVVASLWGSTPVHEGTLGWYSVYGQVLATAIFAWLLCQLAKAGDDAALGRGTPLRWALLLLAAVTSFGVGIGMALVFPIVAYLILPPSSARRRTVATQTVVAVIIPPLYWAMLQLYEKLYGPSKELGIVYSGVRFPATVLRLLADLTGDGVVALLGGIFVNGIDFPSRVMYAAAAAFVVVLLVVCWRASARERRLVLAGFLLCLGCYGLIALGRAPFCVQGTVDAVARAARYHYAATWPLALITAVVLARLGRWTRAAPAVRDAAVLFFSAALIVSQLRWGPRIDQHTAARVETDAAVAAMRAAIDATPPGGDVYIDARPFTAIGMLLQRRMDLFPGWAAVFVIFFPSNRVDGRQVYFVSAPQVVAAARPGSRTASLLVTPEQRR